jgi:predicted Zn-dependent peptidase
MIAFDAGARAEGEKYSAGLAHMLEHMVFKGTERRHYLEIPREIGFLGGSVNAFTSQEVVAFHISVPYEHTDQAMDILSDIVFNSTFPEEEFLKEREVVKEEELSSKDSVESFIWESFIAEFYDKRLAVPVIGTQESISGFTTKELKKFHKKFYSKSNAIVSLCSNHSKRDGKKMLNKYFGRSSGKVKHDVTIFSPEYKEARTVTITRPQLEHAYVWMCYPGRPIGASGEAVEDMLFSIFGHGMDSRLFTEVREKRGLCYSIGSYGMSGRDYSSVVITSSTREENLDEMLALIEVEIEKLRTELVTEEELERARNKYRAGSYAIAERSYSLAKTTLTREFYGLSTLEEVDAEADLVTAEDIREMAKVLFDESKRLILICKEEEKNED